MADADVTITAGTGTKIDTRTVGAGVDEHRQVIVIGDPTTAAGVAGADATNGLDVDVTRVVPGTTATALGKAEDAAHTDGDTGVLALGVRNHTGVSADGDYAPFSMASDGHLHVDLHTETIRVTVQSSGLTTATTAYTAGDTLGAQFTIANAAYVSGGSGRIKWVTLVDASDVVGALDVVFTDTTVTLAADNAAYAISDADALNVVGVVPLAGAYDIGNNRVAQSGPTNIPYVCNGTTSLFAGLITRSGHTFFGAATALQLIVYLERD